MKKMLMNASVASMIYKFNMDNIELLKEMGYTVEVACNFSKKDNPIKEEEIEKFRLILKEKGIEFYETDCPRSIFSFSKMKKTYKQLKTIIDNGEYELIHTQSPIGGVICRLAARKARSNGTKVIYTAHGFHFYKGAPIQNWLIFYPIEKLCSRFNDVLITINKEDYRRAKNFSSPKVEYIPGVGVDISRFKGCAVTKEEKRAELGIPNDALVLLSVGELSSRKNHQVVIKALGELRDKEVVYLIAGNGEDYENYKTLAKDCGVEKQVVLLGARTDVDALCIAADVFVHPSVREGLGIAPLEGMAAGLPLISSYVNGIQDYTKDGITGCCIENPLDVASFVKAIAQMKCDSAFRLKCGEHNKEVVENFSLEASKTCMKEIYTTNLMGGGYYHLIRLLKRHELGLKGNQYMLLSVGELNKNKNHQVIIEALQKVEDKSVFYFIAGQGEEQNHLEALARDKGLDSNVCFLGYRSDIRDLLFAADAFCFMSKREGLGLAGVEALASGLPLITSNVHGINDYSVHGKTGYSYEANDVIGVAKGIIALRGQSKDSYLHNADISMNFDKKLVKRRMQEIYNFDTQ